jgi:hypothetical protein
MSVSFSGSDFTIACLITTCSLCDWLLIYGLTRWRGTHQQFSGDPIGSMLLSIQRKTERPAKSMTVLRNFLQKVVLSDYLLIFSVQSVTFSFVKNLHLWSISRRAGSYWCYYSWCSQTPDAGAQLFSANQDYGTRADSGLLVNSLSYNVFDDGSGIITLASYNAVDFSEVGSPPQELQCAINNGAVGATSIFRVDDF